MSKKCPFQNDTCCNIGIILHLNMRGEVDIFLYLNYILVYGKGIQAQCNYQMNNNIELFKLRVHRSYKEYYNLPKFCFWNDNFRKT